MSSSDEEEDNLPPLHKLLEERRENVTVEDVQALINKYSDAAKEKDEDERLPLHRAACYGASVEVVQLLIKEYPDAVKEKNGNGSLPLHIAVSEGASVEVIQLLIKEYPDGAKEKNENGDLPLHIAVGNGASDEVIQLLIKEYPDGVKEKGYYGKMPLHNAVGFGASVEVIQLLIKEYPDAVKEKNENEDLPLHIAVEEGASDEVIQLLIKEYPEALKEKGYIGKLPLHYAVGNGASVEVIQLLIDKYPDGAKEKDEYGSLPLHYAVGNGASDEVIQLLIKEYPDALKEKDEDGKLPLHIAVEEGASDEVIQLLIKEYPDALKEKNEYGKMPLHIAVGNGASDEVIQLLIKEYPDAVKEKGYVGKLPLHYAIGNGASVEVIQLLIKEYPDGAKEKDEYGNLPLHIAVEEGASDEVIQLLLKEYPDAVKEKGYVGKLPLHYAIGNGASVEVIQLLIKEYPDGAKEKDEYGNLPLHIAVEEGASDEVIQLLIKEYPDAVKEKGYVGKLPLHYAIGNGASVEVIQLLIKEYPDGAKEKDEYGNLPLHIAVEEGASDEVIQLLLKEYPDAVKEKNEDGKLPLHRAVEKGASVEVIQLLIDKYPDAVKEKGYYGLLPLHYAVGNGASVEVIQLLIKEYPDGAREKDEYGKLPLHWAVGSGASDEVIQLLIDKYPDGAKEKNEYGKLPLHIAIDKVASIGSFKLILNAHSLAAKGKMKDGRLPIEVYLENKDAEDLVVLALLTADMPVAIEDGMPVEHSGSWCTCVNSDSRISKAAVRQILLSIDEGGAGYGKYIHALADVRDAEGRTALGAASAEARTEIHKYLLFCGRYKLHIGPPVYRTASSTLFRAQDLDEKADYEEIFDEADKDKNGNLDKKELNAIAESIGLDPDLFLKGSDKKTVSKDDFVGICKRQLGDGPREVVIKFMQSEDHWERETKARADFKLNPKYVVSALPNIPSQTEIAEAVDKGDGGLDAIEEQFLGGVKPGKYAIIMNAAERNLHQILYQEQPKIDAVRDMLRQVFEAVKHLHEKKLMHGDLKMVNIVRFRIDNKLRLIDLDASARMSKIGEVEKSYAGAKSSSAILPPEMIERIVSKKELEKFEKYWKAENDKDLYEKVKPKPYKERGVLKAHYVVKSFRTKNGQPVHNGLPYKLVNASSSIDEWSLGVLAFTLLTGESLIPSTFVDDCASGAAMHVLYSWGTQPEVLSELFKKIHDGAARDLVRQLLQYEPADRPSISTLLETHAFFNPRSGVLLEKLDDMDAKLEIAAKNRQDDRALLEKMNANILVIKQLGDESKVELYYTRQVLVKAIFEATEVNIPTTFIVLEKELPAPADPSEVEKMLDIIAKEDGSGVSMETECASVTISAEGADIALKGKLKEYHEQVKTGMKWANHIKDISSKVAAGDVNKAFEAINKAIEDLTVGDEMYLYLVDELTGQPVRAKGWPLKITKPSDLVHKLVPLMLVGMRGLSICNGVAGLARMCGYPVPKVPETVLKGARESVQLLKQESSVEKFGVVHEEVKGGTEEKKSVRGASLREFMDFLDKNDPGLKEGKNGDFAGLQRIGDPEDGTALWTVLTDPKDIEKALQDRAKQRKEEQRQEEVEQLRQNMHPNAVKKEVELEEEEGNEVEIPEENLGSTVVTPMLPNENRINVAEGQLTADVINRLNNSRNPFVGVEEIAELIQAAKEATAAAKEANSPSTVNNYYSVCPCTIM